MVDQHDLALARARVLLAEIAPEIPEDEIIPGAHVADDLGLDLVSLWALATGLEKMAKVDIKDADIIATTTLGSLLEHALSDVPLEFQNSKSSKETDDAEVEYDVESQAPNDATHTENAADNQGDLQSALENLANLFNQ